jgi:hypothetical protein
MEGIPEGLPPEETERLIALRGKLIQFVLLLIQSFLRTGYYTPEHPESKRAREGLYHLFKDLFGTEDELAFLVRDDQGRQEIFVEGILPETQRLSRMMLRGMGEIYVPKFAHYMERKDLISLTLKSSMGPEEFNAFIDIMSEPSLVDTKRRQDKERFARALLDHGILHLSYVFNEELLAPDREIPWRARLTLSRMKKDLKMLPLYEKMTRQNALELKKNLLWDGLRMIRHSDLFCAVLRHSDLAAPSESMEESIEDEIIAAFRRPYLTGTARIFLREHLELKTQRKQDAFESKSDRLVKKVSHALKQEDSPEAEQLLEAFFRNQLLPLEDLPARLKDKIILERMTDKFLNYTEEFFQKLDRIDDKEGFLNIARAFARMLPELVQRNRYPEIRRIVETFKHHFNERRTWSLIAGHILEEIGTGPLPSLLEEKFLSGKKEIRSEILPIFVSLEIGSIPNLLNILKKATDQWVRKHACEAIIQIGPVAAMHLLRVLEKQETSVETTCDILRVLGEIKSEPWNIPLAEALTPYLVHEHPRLREQALHTLCTVQGLEREETYLKFLQDPDLEVQKRAMWCLGMLKSEKGLEQMTALLDRGSESPSPRPESLETHLYHVLGIAGNQWIRGKTVEQVLLDVLEKKGPKKWWNPFQTLSMKESSLEAICDTLGRIGTLESIKILTRISMAGDTPWASKAREAIKRIEERTATLKSRPF